MEVQPGGPEFDVCSLCGRREFMCFVWEEESDDLKTATEACSTANWTLE